MWSSLFVLVSLAAAPVKAEAPTIDADRPGFLYAGSTVPVGYAQLEVGLPDLAIATDGRETTSTSQLGALLRVGLLPGLEVQLGQAFVHRDTAREATSAVVDGHGDLLLGAKLSPPSWPSANVEGTLVAQLSLPTGTPALSAGGVGLNLAAQVLWTFTGDKPLWQNVGLLVGFSDTPASALECGQSITIAGSYAFAISRSVGSYVELEQQLGLSHADDALLAGAGIAWLPAGCLQLDAYFDRGLTATSPEWLLGAGVSVLFAD